MARDIETAPFARGGHPVCSGMAAEERAHKVDNLRQCISSSGHVSRWGTSASASSGGCEH